MTWCLIMGLQRICRFMLYFVYHDNCYLSRTSVWNTPTIARALIIYSMRAFQTINKRFQLNVDERRKCTPKVMNPITSCKRKMTQNNDRCMNAYHVRCNHSHGIIGKKKCITIDRISKLAYLQSYHISINLYKINLHILLETVSVTQNQNIESIHVHTITHTYTELPVTLCRHINNARYHIHIKFIACIVHSVW